MRFDVVCGNPPYQESTHSIYPDFVDNAMRLSDSVLMIVNNNWMHSFALNQFKERMLDFGLETVINYPVLSDTFSSVTVAVSIIKLCRGADRVVAYKEIVKGEVVEESVGDFNQPRGNLFISRHSTEVLLRCIGYGRFGFKSVIPITRTDSFGLEPNLGRVEASDRYSEHFNLRCMMSHNRSCFVSDADVRRNRDLIPLYKVVCGSKLSNACKTGIPLINIFDPGVVCTESFSVIYAFDSELLATRAEKYLKSVLFRYLVHLSVPSLASLCNFYLRCVPAFDFTDTSVIDWDQEEACIDSQLFAHFDVPQSLIDEMVSLVGYLHEA